MATSPGVNEKYAAEDLALDSFVLSDDEMAALSAITVLDVD